MSITMACGCKNKATQIVAPRAVTNDRVPLGLDASVALPIRFEKIYMGHDVVVLAHPAAPIHDNAINIPGRDAKVSKSLRDSIVAVFPSMFGEAQVA